MGAVKTGEKVAKAVVRPKKKTPIVKQAVAFHQQTGNVTRTLTSKGGGEATTFLVLLIVVTWFLTTDRFKALLDVIKGAKS